MDVSAAAAAWACWKALGADGAVPGLRLRGSGLGSVMAAPDLDADRRCCSSLLGELA